MAGRIRDEDVVTVRERAQLADVIGESGVQLRSAGGGRLKGLCPFHDEKSPSFNVNPALGYYMCFGCGESGDVITFVRKSEQLSFVEALEWLARRYHVELRVEEGGSAPGRSGSNRSRLIEVHKIAQEFYAEQLGGQEAGLGRQFLAERGFDQAAAATYGVGYAPAGWDVLIKHLRGRGFLDTELITSGIASQGQRGPIDRFRGRLVWPIRDIGGDTIGFGARKLSEDDTGPKYLNTPETPIYKKSTVLYGVDVAKKEIARRRQAVVVEGYTDVMACHLAGVPTAVASCGTAFGADHIGVLRRLLMDQDEFRGEVIYTFDGDSAGQKAALKAFGEEQKFVTQTYVTVSPDGMDPCELRLARGDAAVRDLVAARTPLVEFAVRSTLSRYDLETAEGRVQALAATAPLIAKIKDRALRPEYARRLAGWLGMETDTVVQSVAASTAEGRSPQQRRSALPPVQADVAVLRLEREAAKLAVQTPQLVAPEFDGLAEEVFTDAGFRNVAAAVAKAGGTSTAIAGESWVAAVRAAAPDDELRSLITGLAVEALLSDAEPDERYAGQVLARLQEHAVVRRIAELKPSMQRVNPVEEAERYNRLWGELVQLEATARALRERSIGTL